VVRESGRHQGPEPPAMVGMPEVGQFMHDHRIQHIVRHPFEPVGNSNVTGGCAAGAPAFVLIGDPPDASDACISF